MTNELKEKSFTFFVGLTFKICFIKTIQTQKILSKKIYDFQCSFSLKIFQKPTNQRHISNMSSSQYLSYFGLAISCLTAVIGLRRLTDMLNYNVCPNLPPRGRTWALSSSTSGRQRTAGNHEMRARFKLTVSNSESRDKNRFLVYTINCWGYQKTGSIFGFNRS